MSHEQVMDAELSAAASIHRAIEALEVPLSPHTGRSFTQAAAAHSNSAAARSYAHDEHAGAVASAQRHDVICAIPLLDSLHAAERETLVT